MATVGLLGHMLVLFLVLRDTIGCYLNSLHILNINLLSDKQLTNICPSLCTLSLNPADCFLFCAKAFSFNVNPCSVFYCISLLWESYKEIDRNDILKKFPTLSSNEISYILYFSKDNTCINTYKKK